LEAYLRRVEWDKTGVVARLYPFTRKRTPDEPKVIVIDPRISFGRPRYTGMRRESVARLEVRHLDPEYGLRDVKVKGGATRDIPLPDVVSQFLQMYINRVLVTYVPRVAADTPIFWSRWGRPGRGKAMAPMAGKNVWRLCKTYGRLIGCPTLKPHDLRHGVAMEVYEAHHDLEPVRALLGHARMDTTQIYASIRPQQLKRAVSFNEGKAAKVLGAGGS